MDTYHEVDAAFREALGRLRGSGRYLLLMDQGGTNVRIRVYPAGARWRWPLRAWRSGQGVELKRSDVRSAQDLYAVIGAVAGALRTLVDPATGVRAVLAFAGPISSERDSVPITNWVGQPVLTLDEVEATLHRAPALMLNDVEAASYGLLALEETGDWPERTLEFTPGGAVRREPRDRARNKALVVPGTGVGTAFIVHTPRIVGGVRRDWPEVVPCEVQHIPIAAQTADEAALIEWLRVNRTEGRPPCYESIVSGAGLENVYDYLTSLGVSGASRPEGGDHAGWIASHAATDSRCGQALGLYYAYCGRLAQTLALAVKAFGGVYLAGDTTAHNWEFVQTSAYARNFWTNHKQVELLAECPLYLLDRPGLNLDGALYAASHRWYLRPADR